MNLMNAIHDFLWADLLSIPLPMSKETLNSLKDYEKIIKARKNKWN